MLARIYDNKIVYPIYKHFVEICGRYLFNPTEQTYLDLGFEELPVLEPREGYHTEYSIQDGVIVANYVENPIIEDEDEEEQDLSAYREEQFRKEFFETSLGWVRRKATMKDGSIDNFLTDDLPLLAIGLQSGLSPKVIVYSTPDFTQDFDVLSLQSYVNVTPQFIEDCLQEKQSEFI